MSLPYCESKGCVKKKENLEKNSPNPKSNTNYNNDFQNNLNLNLNEKHQPDIKQNVKFEDFSAIENCDISPISNKSDEIKQESTKRFKCF